MSPEDIPDFFKDYTIYCEGGYGGNDKVDHMVENCVSNVALGITFPNGTAFELWYPHGYNSDEDERREFPRRVDNNFVAIYEAIIKHEIECRRHRNGGAPSNP